VILMAGNCEVCGCWCRARCKHHIYHRGMGGGSECNLPENILWVGLDPLLDCQCHTRIHNGAIPRSRLWEIVENRMGLQSGEAKARVDEWLRCPKEKRGELSWLKI
jgi:hypothetical protein